MSQFFYGVIEGFYGRQWSWRVRQDYAPFLAKAGFDCYIFAPKGEPLLRSHWRQPLGEVTCRHLQLLAESYRLSGLRWGLGLSPLGLSAGYSAEDARQLERKVVEINTLSPDILCILFDDMRGDIPALAERQVQIVDTVLQHSTARQHIVCPTYYSFDPVLEEVFGTMPGDYWQELGDGMPGEVGVFWTGNRVISPAVTPTDIRQAAAALGRKPVLWDNYPVNDGRKTCSHLHLRPYQGRSSELAVLTSGHLVNPMNQPWLSRLVLQSLQALYGEGEGYSTDKAWQRALAMLGDESLARQLDGDLKRFQDGGLENMSAQTRSMLSDCYSRFVHPAAAEVVDWLGGGYDFDPACLTG